MKEAMSADALDFFEAGYLANELVDQMADRTVHRQESKLVEW